MKNIKRYEEQIVCKENLGTRINKVESYETCIDNKKFKISVSCISFEGTYFYQKKKFQKFFICKRNLAALARNYKNWKHNIIFFKY